MDASQSARHPLDAVGVGDVRASAEEEHIRWQRAWVSNDGCGRPGVPPPLEARQWIQLPVETDMHIKTI